MARLIFDTRVLVAGARGRFDLAAIPDEDDVAVPAVVVAGYLAGVWLQPDAARRAADRAFLDDLLAVVPVEDYSHTVAEHPAELLAHCRRAGMPLGTHDLIIAARARATNRIILTTNERARFDELPDVAVRLVVN